MAKPAIRAWNPSADEQRAFQSTDPTFQWLCNMPVGLVRQYAGKWIAAKDDRIVAAADSMDALLEQLGDADLQTVIVDRIERPVWMVYR